MTTTPSPHPNIQKVAADLAAAGAAGQIRVLEEAAPTAAAAAAHLGCEIGAIANSLVFDGDGSPVLILTSGAHRVDTAKLATGLGLTRLRRATPEFVREHTGQPIGGVAPVGARDGQLPRTAGAPRSGTRAVRRLTSVTSVHWPHWARLTSTSAART